MYYYICGASPPNLRQTYLPNPETVLPKKKRLVMPLQNE